MLSVNQPHQIVTFCGLQGLTTTNSDFHCPKYGRQDNFLTQTEVCVCLIGNINIASVESSFDDFAHHVGDLQYFFSIASGLHS